MSIPDEALYAAIAEMGVKPDFRALYPALYAKYQAALTELRSIDELHEDDGSPFAAELAELRRITGDRVELHVKYSSDPERKPASYTFYSFVYAYTDPHATFEGARIELLAKCADTIPDTEPQPAEAAAIVAAAEEAARGEQ